MARKKSGKKAAREFSVTLVRLEQFLDSVDAAGLADQDVTWAYEGALIKIYVAFEQLMLACLVVAINNDSSTLSATVGIKFPAHLDEKVCEHLVTKGGFFNFSGGRSGLIKKINEFVPPNHWLVIAIKNSRYLKPLDTLIALRNFAAHESKISKKRALDAVGQERMSSAGAWLKIDHRARKLIKVLSELGDGLEAAAPY
jgi:hypothetical protein